MKEGREGENKSKVLSRQGYICWYVSSQCLWKQVSTRLLCCKEESRDAEVTLFGEMHISPPGRPSVKRAPIAVTLLASLHSLIHSPSPLPSTPSPHPQPKRFGRRNSSHSLTFSTVPHGSIALLCFKGCGERPLQTRLWGWWEWVSLSVRKPPSLTSQPHSPAFSLFSWRVNTTEVQSAALPWGRGPLPAEAAHLGAVSGCTSQPLSSLFLLGNN